MCDIITQLEIARVPVENTSVCGLEIPLLNECTYQYVALKYKLLYIEFPLQNECTFGDQSAGKYLKSCVNRGFVLGTVIMNHKIIFTDFCWKYNFSYVYRYALMVFHCTGISFVQENQDLNE